MSGMMRVFAVVTVGIASAFLGVCTKADVSRVIDRAGVESVLEDRLDMVWNFLDDD